MGNISLTNVKEMWLTALSQLVKSNVTVVCPAAQNVPVPNGSAKGMRCAFLGPEKMIGDVQ